MSQNGHEEEIMAHEETMTLHQAGLSQPSPGPQDRARLIETVIESELDVSDDALMNLRAKDFPLGNFDDEEVDTTEFKWMAEILDLFTKSRYPHPDSGLQGLSRAWAAQDSSERRQALGLDEFAKDESFKMGAFSRAKRGEDGFQQETASKSVNETHAVRDSNGSSGNGLLSRFRS